MEHARLRPRFARIAEAITYSGISRTRLYEWGRKRSKLFRKNGSRSIIDFDELDAILDELPLGAKEEPRSLSDSNKKKRKKTERPQD